MRLSQAFRWAKRAAISERSISEAPKVNVPRDRRRGPFLGRLYGTGVFYPMVCGDPGHQVRAESDRSATPPWIASSQADPSNLIYPRRSAISNTYSLKATARPLLTLFRLTLTRPA